MNGIRGLSTVLVALTSLLVVPPSAQAEPVPAAAPPNGPPPVTAPTKAGVVPELTTEERIVHRQPDGSMLATLNVEPVRVSRGSGWVPVDTTLMRRADGSIGPRAIPSLLTFSPGGKAPLVRLAKAGKSVALTWPGPLPKPVVSGDTATYAEVLPGVDLLMRAEAKGYAQRLVVKTAAAAKNPALTRIRLGLATTGVRLKSQPSGALQALDADGNPVFEAAPPSMWENPKAKAVKQSPVKVELADRALTLVPNAALLTDPAAQFPITIDPDMKTYSKSGWTKVFQGYPNQSYWNGSNDVSTDKDWAKIGYCDWAFCNGIKITRAYFQFDTSALSGDIMSVQLQSTVVWSPSCSGSGSHQLYRASGTINSGTTWNNMPSGSAKGTRTAPHVYSGCTGYKPISFDGQDSVSTTGTSTYYLRAVSEGDRYDWRKYKASDTKLVVRYNHPPRTPTNLRSDPPLPAACKHCAGTRYIGAQDSIRFTGYLSDPNGDQLRPEWFTWIDGVGDYSMGSLGGSGVTRSYTLDLRNKNGKTIKWGVRGWDTYNGANYSSSAWAYSPSFEVDRTAPGVAPTVAGVLYQDDGLWHGGTTVSDNFTFTANGVADINHYVYGWQDPPTTVAYADRLGGNGTTPSLTPPGDGPRTLYVRSVDRAGNKSPTKAYRIYVRSGNGAMAHWAFNGDTKDTAYPSDTLGDKTGTLTGPTSYGPGAVGLGLRLEAGSQMSAWAKRIDPAVKSILRTDAAFSVGGWVRADTVAGTQTVLSQLGTTTGGFQLGIKGGKWFFGMPQSDSATATLDEVVSASDATAGVWTHVVGRYSKYSDRISLFVNGAKVGEAPHTTAWHATDELRIGNTMRGGVTADPFTGAVDEIKMWDRALLDTEVAGLVGQDNVQVAHWPFDDPAKVDDKPNTTAVNEVDGGADAVLIDGAKFTPDGAEKGAVSFDGVDDSATANAPLLQTNQSFSVSAWVSTANTGVGQTALSQDATRVGGFALGYQPVDATNGRWVFSLPRSDADGSAVDQSVSAPFPKSSLSAESWRHLTGVYDATTGKLTLYVDGAAAVSVTRAATSWTAAGAFRIGRVLQNGAPTSYWSGRIDDARVYNRAVSAAEVKGLVAQAEVAAGRWALDGSAAALPVGKTGSLVGEVLPTWTAGQTDSPDPADLAVKLDGIKKQYVTGKHTLDTSQSFAVVAWAKVDKLGVNQTVVSQDGNSHSAFQLGTALDSQGGTKWAFTRFDTDGSSGISRAFGSTVQVGVWAHLVGIYNRERNLLEIYVNGVLAGSLAYPSANAWNHATGAVIIGARKYSGNRDTYFTGAIDDVEAYERALFPDEITDLAGRDLALKHNWRLDEASGSLAADATGALTGSVTGGAAFAPGRVGNAIKLDGVGASVGSGPLTSVTTDKSFTVSAWVHLDRARTNTSTMTAFSLDGARQSKFRLGHRVDSDQYLCEDAQEASETCGAWVFELPESDTDNARITKAALSVMHAEVGRWVHLVGVYDQPRKKIWLYVDGSRVADGTLNTAWTHPTTNGHGGVRIGRGKVNGTASQYWSGRVDDPRLYAGALTSSRITNLFRSYSSVSGGPGLPESIAGHWKFDEGTGADGLDSSGKEVPVVLNGSASWVGGRTGSAAWLDGSTAFAEASQPVVDTSRSFSVAAWAYLTNPGTTTRTVIAQDGSTAPESRRSAFLLQYRPTTKTWGILVPEADSDTAKSAWLGAEELARTGEWTHLVLSYDAPLQQLRLYVNGLLAAARTGVPTFASTGNLAIGRARWSGQNTDFFPGGIDDVRAYQKALTDVEVRAIHDEAPGITHGSWRFNDGTGRDYAWRGVNLSLFEGATFTDGVDGKALSLPAAPARAVAPTGTFGVSTRDSFTVSAWAKLTKKGTSTSPPGTVVSQDAARNSGFALQYRPDSDRWAFVSYDSDTDNAAPLLVRSIGSPALNQWVHLTGVYDHPRSQLRLYLNGVLQGHLDGVTMYDAMDKIAVGRGQRNGLYGEYFTGAVDEIQFGQGVLADEEIAHRASWPAAPGGQFGRYVNAAGDRATASTDNPPAGYRFEGTLGMPAPEGAADTKLLYSCRTSGGDMFTFDQPDCGPHAMLGPIGTVYAVPPAGVRTVPVNRCNTGPDHFDARDANCGAATNEGVLGYTLAYAPMARYVNPVGYDHPNGVHIDHWSTVDGTPPGYRLEGLQGYLPLVAATGTTALQSCRNGIDQYISLDAACDTKTVLGPLGQLFTDTPPEDHVGALVYRCVAGGQKFLSLDELCEGQTPDTTLGHVLAVLPGTDPS